MTVVEVIGLLLWGLMVLACDLGGFRGGMKSICVDIIIGNCLNSSILVVYMCNLAFTYGYAVKICVFGALKFVRCNFFTPLNIYRHR